MTELSAADREALLRRYARHPRLVYRSIADIASVTYFDYRFYDRLLDYWAAVHAHQGRESRLSARFLADSQLLVEWTGNPRSSRRLVLVTHVDREGFALTSCRESNRGGPALVFDGFITNRAKLESARRGADVAVCIDNPPRTLPGTLLNINVGGEAGDVQIRVPFQNLNAARRVSIVFDESAGVLASAHYSFGKPHFRERRGEISASCVDNFAGVATATSALTDVALNSRPVNLSILYSTSEEAGFLGVLAIARNDPDAFFRDAGESVWCVLDSSSVDKSTSMGMDEWQTLRSHDRDLTNSNRQCRFGTAAVRLEDLCSLFDVSVARFLYQAAVESNASPDGERYREAWKSEVCEVGMFQGGVCEASVLGLMPRLVTFLSPGSSGSIRCGSIAIPLGNYRNLFGKHVSPEECHVGALEAARMIVLQAADLVRDYHFETPEPFVYRGPTPSRPDLPKDEAALFKHWIARADRNNAYLDRHRAWAASRGNERLAAARL